jgi:hypothetical protein
MPLFMASSVKSHALCFGGMVSVVRMIRHSAFLGAWRAAVAVFEHFYKRVFVAALYGIVRPWKRVPDGIESNRDAAVTWRRLRRTNTVLFCASACG